MKLVLHLEITDPETVENYKDVHQDLILEDIIHGTLADQLEMVAVSTCEDDD